MKTLFLLRHGETEYNSLQIIQGWLDSPLTKNGVEQALFINEYFKEHKILFNKAFSSSSGRAIETLKIACPEISYEISDELREIGFGNLEGKSGKIPLKYLTLDNEYLLPFGGEERDKATMRFSKKLKEIMDNNEGNIICVSHCAIMTNFLRIIDYETFENMLEIHVPNCVLYVFNYDNEKFILKDVVLPVF